MTITDFAGLQGGLAGAGLFLAGVLVSLLAALRLALTLRRPPERTRIARGTAAGAGVTAALGAALFWGSELLPQRRELDRLAVWVAMGAVVAGVLTAARVARRRPLQRADAASAEARTPPAGPA